MRWFARRLLFYIFALWVSLTLTFLLPLVLTSGGGQPGPAGLVVMLLYYWALYSIQVFFSVATMSCAAIRMDGGDPTVGDGLRGAMAHLPSILVWGAIAGTVGVVLRIIEGRSELLGKIIAAVVGVAWTSLTYFVVPVMVFERRSAFAAIGHSGALFRSRWGEAMAGEAGLGLASFVLALLGGLPLLLGSALGAGALLWVAAPARRAWLALELPSLGSLALWTVVLLGHGVVVDLLADLSGAPALDVANAINQFLRSEREVQQTSPVTLSPFEQIEKEVVVVPETVSNSLIVSATPPCVRSRRLTVNSFLSAERSNCFILSQTTFSTVRLSGSLNFNSNRPARSIV